MGITSRNVETKADGKKLTLDELRDFVADLGRAGAAGTTPIDGRVSWGGGLRSISATAYGPATTPPPARHPHT